MQYENAGQVEGNSIHNPNRADVEPHVFHPPAKAEQVDAARLGEAWTWLQNQISEVLRGKSVKCFDETMSAMHEAVSKTLRAASLKQETQPPSKLDDYTSALSGVGPLASEWKDKPHRLVYDLVKMLLASSSPLETPAEIIPHCGNCGQKMIKVVGAHGFPTWNCQKCFPTPAPTDTGAAKIPDFKTINTAIEDLGELAEMLREKEESTGFDCSIAMRLEQVAQTLKSVEPLASTGDTPQPQEALPTSEEIAAKIVLNEGLDLNPTEYSDLLDTIDSVVKVLAATLPAGEEKEK